MDYYDKLEPLVFNQIAELLRGSHHVIEIGCGAGKLSNFLAQSLGCRVTGIDINADSLTTGIKESKQIGLSHKVHYQQWNAEQLSLLTEDTYDACVSLYVVHELDHPVKVFREIYKVLKKDGLMVNVDFPPGSIAEKLYDEYYYAPHYMKSLLSRAGFCRVSVQFTPCSQLAYFIGIR